MSADRTPPPASVLATASRGALAFRRRGALAVLHRGALAVFLALIAAVLPAAAAPPAGAPVQVRLIAFNDFHGHLEAADLAIGVPDPADPGASIPLRVGGAAFLAGRIAQLRAEVPHSVVLSAGDLIGASPLPSALFRDEPTIEVMNLIGLDLNAVGNHEFDHGVAELRRQIDGGCLAERRGAADSCRGPAGRYAGAGFPFIAANVVAKAGGAPLLAGSVVRTIDGVAVGFIGAVTRATPRIVLPEGVRDWRWQREAEAINREAHALRARGVQALVALVHEGGEAEGGINGCANLRGPIVEIARAIDPAVDLIVSAHTHRAYNCRVDGRLVIQSASFGRLVAVIDLALDRASGRVLRERIVARNVPVTNDRNDSANARLLAAYPPAPADARVAALVDHYVLAAAPLTQRPIGRLAAAFDRRSTHGDSALGRLVADAQLAATRSKGAQIALTNPGGLRADLVPAADGTVNFGAAFRSQPFGNALVTLTITGAQLRQALEAQWNRNDPTRVRFLQPSAGLSYAYRSDRPHGQRVEPDSLRLHGRRIDPEARLRVTVNLFLADGGDDFNVFRDGTARSGGPLDVEALADFIGRESAQQPLAPDPVERIRRLD